VIEAPTGGGRARGRQPRLPWRRHEVTLGLVAVATAARPFCVPHNPLEVSNAN
jgi:hypothetical protein